jgi:CheY-like chemotaxis protein
VNKKIRILVIDDEPLIRRAFQKLFSAEHYELSLAEDGQQGLDIWRKQEFDFVFLDVLMPALNGWEVLEEKKEWGQTRVQVMSAFTGDLTDRKKWIEKIDGFLPKPFENVMGLLQWVESFRK